MTRRLGRLDSSAFARLLGVWHSSELSQREGFHLKQTASEVLSDKNDAVKVRNLRSHGAYMRELCAFAAYISERYSGPLTTLIISAELRHNVFLQHLVIMSA